MAQSLSKLYIHLVFHIKTDSPIMREEDTERIHAYIGQLVNVTGCQVRKVGGTDNHVHVLFLLSKDNCLSHVVEEIKRNSSRWMKSQGACYQRFAWQSGYAAFSVSQSVVEKTVQYIENQREHHAKHTFQEEYLKLLELYDVKYDKDYVFRD